MIKDNDFYYKIGTIHGKVRISLWKENWSMEHKPIVGDHTVIVPSTNSTARENRTNLQNRNFTYINELLLSASGQLLRCFTLLSLYMSIL